MLRCIIFTRGRAGSGSVFSALRAHRALTGINEPFHREQYEGRYKADTEEELTQKLDDVWREYNLIKHAWAEHGWPFLADEAGTLNKLLLKQPGVRYLFLNRRNILARFVSVHIAIHSSIWSPDMERAGELIRAASYPPIDEALLQDALVNELRQIAELAALLREENLPYHEVWYEDLFMPWIAIEERMERYDRILRFLGLSTETCDRDAARSVLTLEGRKLNNRETYECIPGIRAINAKYGSDSTGWLFEPE